MKEKLTPEMLKKFNEKFVVERTGTFIEEIIPCLSDGNPVVEYVNFDPQGTNSITLSVRNETGEAAELVTIEASRDEEVTFALVLIAAVCDYDPAIMTVNLEERYKDNAKVFVLNAKL